MKTTLSFIWQLRRSNIARMFRSVHSWKSCDYYKWALYYGRLLYEKSKYDKHGMIDLKERNKRIDRIISHHQNPTDINVFMKRLLLLKRGAVKANTDGLVGAVSANASAESMAKIEAARYVAALDCLDILYLGCVLYPKLWKKIFVRTS